MIGTSNLVVGLDIKGVERVVIWGGFYSKLDVMQAAGRAGRHLGERGICSIVSSETNLELLGLSNGCISKTIEQGVSGPGVISCLESSRSLCSYCQSKVDQLNHSSPSLSPQGLLRKSLEIGRRNVELYQLAEKV